MVTILFHPFGMISPLRHCRAQQVLPKLLISPLRLGRGSAEPFPNGLFAVFLHLGLCLPACLLLLCCAKTECMENSQIDSKICRLQRGVFPISDVLLIFLEHVSRTFQNCEIRTEKVETFICSELRDKSEICCNILCGKQFSHMSQINQNYSQPICTLTCIIL